MNKYFWNFNEHEEVWQNSCPTICGYQRKNVRHDPREVNCKLCLKEMEKRGI